MWRRIGLGAFYRALASGVVLIEGDILVLYLELVEWDDVVP